MYDELIQRLRICAKKEANCVICGKMGEGDCFDRIKTEAADAIEELSVVVKAQKAVLDKFPRWIPVTERLPEPHEEVLVCNEEYGLSELGFAMAAVWDGADWIETWNKREEIHCVTHWMPLPEPPKETE